MQPDPVALPEHEPQLYAALRAAGVDAGEALSLTTAIFPRPAPAPDPRAVQRQRQREHVRQPIARKYTGI
ncbi:MAG: hypothetical protein WAS73_13065 [Defluviicoccus sp.]